MSTKALNPRLGATVVDSLRPKVPSTRNSRTVPPLTFYEFFCGGGMARAGLGAAWNCLFANDFDIKKGAVYTDNWGGDVLRTADVGKLTVSDLPGHAAMVWASFPCQDLSLAGMGAGLRGDRSGTFWPFWRLMKDLQCNNRAPRVIVLENVCGTLTSHKGKDFAAIAGALSEASYKFGGLIVDAADFVAHSRPRLFIIAAHSDIEIPSSLVTDGTPCRFHTPGLRVAQARLPGKVRDDWVWWRVTTIERGGVVQHASEETPIRRN